MMAPRENFDDKRWSERAEEGAAAVTVEVDGTQHAVLLVDVDFLHGMPDCLSLQAVCASTHLVACHSAERERVCSMKTTPKRYESHGPPTQHNRDPGENDKG